MNRLTFRIGMGLTDALTAAVVSTAVVITILFSAAAMLSSTAEAGGFHRAYARGYYAGYYSAGYYSPGYYSGTATPGYTSGYRGDGAGAIVSGTSGPYYGGWSTPTSTIQHGSMYSGGYRPSYSYGLYNAAGYAAPVVYQPSFAPYGYSTSGGGYDYAPYRAAPTSSINVAPNYVAPNYVTPTFTAPIYTAPIYSTPTVDPHPTPAGPQSK